ncbi:MAG: guanylate kinase [Acidobacteria bacterium]|nr:guanylate kinase [Acidobacteriota bacterium]
MSEAPGKTGESADDVNDCYQGILFVISSPSGGGKGTLIKRLREAVPGVGYSVSWTTRAPRPGEVDGVNYRFVSEVEFAAMIRAQGFVEWAVVHGHHYGTTRAAVAEALAAGLDIILEIDVQGARAVRTTMESVVSIFILPPSFEVLRERLTLRMTERPEELELRLANARGEVAEYRHFDYLILNDEVERAAAQLSSVVWAERARRERQEWVARRVLKTFGAPAAR